MGVGASHESMSMRPIRVVETTVEDTAIVGGRAVGMVENDVTMVVAGRRSPRKKSAKKSPAKKSAKKSPAKKSAKKSPAKKSAKKSPAKKMKMHGAMHDDMKPAYSSKKSKKMKGWGGK
jgi:uncharacterized protein YcbX